MSATKRMNPFAIETQEGTVKEGGGLRLWANNHPSAAVVEYDEKEWYRKQQQKKKKGYR